MNAIDLDKLDTSNLMPTEMTELRQQLYAAAQEHEAQAARYWSAYWKTMGLTHRPLTPEQLAAQSTTKLAPVNPPKPKRETGVRVSIS
jgi:hypothetical protein